MVVINWQEFKKTGLLLTLTSYEYFNNGYSF